MIVHKLVVHQLLKKQGETIASSDLSNSLLPVSVGGEAYQMIEELEKRYALLSQTYATFDPDTSTTIKKFPIHLESYINNDSENDFLTFSIDTSKVLQDIVQSLYNAKGGYLIFIEYEIKSKYIAVFFVRNRKGRFLEKDAKTNTFKINESIYIDVDHLAMAGRINVSLLKTDKRYLTFINKRNEDSEYFLRWMCAYNKLSSREDTKVFREILNEITLPVGVTERMDFIKNVLSHIKTSSSKNVDLRTIGTVFYGDSERLITFIEENDKIINHEFNPDRSELKKLVVLRASADKITLDFPLDYIKNGTIVVNEAENKIIINSSSLLAKITSEKAFFESTINE
jgi:nucleoid-associated protein